MTYLFRKRRKRTKGEVRVQFQEWECNIKIYDQLKIWIKFNYSLLLWSWNEVPRKKVTQKEQVRGKGKTSHKVQLCLRRTDRHLQNRYSRTACQVNVETKWKKLFEKSCWHGENHRGLEGIKEEEKKLVQSWNQKLFWGHWRVEV